MTLAEKIKKAGEEADTPEEAATELRKMLGKQEHTRVWSKYQTALKGKPKEEQDDFQNKSKHEKGFEAALALVKTEVPKFFHYNESMEHATSLAKREKWVSEKKMLELHGEDDFWAHMESGRIIYRADPLTPNVWNYQDTGDFEKKNHVKKAQHWSLGQEYEPTAEDQQEWQSFLKKDNYSHLRAFSKGSSLIKGKGKGKGKTKGKTPKKPRALLALEDGTEDDLEETTEEEQWKELLVKAKRARDQAGQAKDDCEAALTKADLAKRLTKAAKRDTTSKLEILAKKVKVVKDILAKQDQSMPLQKAKQVLVDTMTAVKAAKEESKELNQVANKAGSKASKGSKK